VLDRVGLIGIASIKGIEQIFIDVQVISQIGGKLFKLFFDLIFLI